MVSQSIALKCILTMLLVLRSTVCQATFKGENHPKTRANEYQASKHNYFEEHVLSSRNPFCSLCRILEIWYGLFSALEDIEWAHHLIRNTVGCCALRLVKCVDYFVLIEAGLLSRTLYVGPLRCCLLKCVYFLFFLKSIPDNLKQDRVSVRTRLPATSYYSGLPFWIKDTTQAYTSVGTLCKK